MSSAALEMLPAAPEAMQNSAELTMSEPEAFPPPVPTRPSNEAAMAMLSNSNTFSESDSSSVSQSTGTFNSTGAASASGPPEGVLSTPPAGSFFNASTERPRLASTERPQAGPVGPVPSSTPSSKRQGLEEMRKFEADRHSYFVEQFQANQLYWQALMELMMANLKGNEKAVKYLTKKIAAYRASAVQLYGIRDTLLGEKKGSTQAMSNRDRGSQRSMSSLPSAASMPLTSRQSSGGGEGEGASAVDGLVEHDCAVAMQLDNLCDVLERDTLRNSLEVMVREADKEAAEINTAGDALLRSLQNIDQHTANAYSEYQRVVGDTIQSNGNNSEGGEVRQHMGDVWLADTNYRVAVRQQLDAWKVVSADLAKLFAQLKALELKRRGTVKACLSDVVQQETAAWTALSATREPLMLLLGSITLEPVALEVEIRERVDKGAVQIKVGTDGKKQDRKGSFAATPTYMQNVQTNAQHAGAEGSGAFIEQMQSPLQSPLIRHMAILERRLGTVMGMGPKWQLALGVLTWDHYLHVFDVPKNSRVRLDSPNPELAFQEMIPVITNPVEQFTGKRASLLEKSSKGPDVLVVPYLSMNLAYSKAQANPDGKQKHCNRFEVTEVIKNTGLKGRFKDVSQKEVLFRSVSEKEMIEWVVKIKSIEIGVEAGSEEKIRAALFT